MIIIETKTNQCPIKRQVVTFVKKVVQLQMNIKTRLGNIRRNIPYSTSSNTDVIDFTSTQKTREVKLSAKTHTINR